MMGTGSEARVRGAILALALAVLAATAVALATPAPASALTIEGPKAAFESARYSVRWASADPTGTVALYRGGSVVATAAGAPGKRVSLGTVRFPIRGVYRLTARVNTTPTPVVSAPYDVRSWAHPGPAVMLGTPAGGLCGRLTRLTVRVDAATTYVTVYVNKRFVRKVAVKGAGVKDLGIVKTGGAVTTIQLATGNPAGYRWATFALRLFSYPSGWHTCIVISTGKRRLYWIRNDVLVKSYPVATGRPSMPTPHRVWRIGAKYHTDWHSVYGPRKMRLFRKSGYRYTYTAYNIHGTNNPHSIGTYASHGCIRLFNRDVMELFPQVPLYTLVQTRR